MTFVWVNAEALEGVKSLCWALVTSWWAYAGGQVEGEGLIEH